MIHELAIPGWHPVRLNQLLHAHYLKAARMKKADRMMVAFYAWHFKIPSPAGKRRVSLQITLAPRQRGGDPDAFWKSLLDSLVHAALLRDDNRQGVELGPVTFSRGVCKVTTIILEDLPQKPS